MTRELTVHECDSCGTRFDTHNEAVECELSHMTSEQAVAEQLHTIFCHSNHTDACDWLYGDWSNPTWARRYYLTRAQFVLDYTNRYDLDSTELLNFIKELK